MKNRLSIFKEIWNLQFENYKKDLYNIFSGWIITLVIMLVWLTFRDTSIKSDPFVLASAIGVVGIRNCGFNFVRTIYKLKQTKFFTRIFSTNISKGFTFFIIILFNQATNLLISAVFFGIGMLYADQSAKVVDVNWAMFIAGYLLLALMSNLLGFIIGFTVKKLDIAITIACFYYFGAIYFLGLGFPWTTLAKYKGFTIASYFFPQRYALNIMAAGWINRPDMTVNETVDFGFGHHPWIPYVVSVVIILLGILTMILLLKKEYEFGNKQYKRYRTVQKHLVIIRQIKRATSVEELKKVIEDRNEINHDLIKIQKKHKKTNKHK